MIIKHHFNVWIVSVSDVYVETLLGRLVRNGWTVSPPNGQVDVSWAQPNDMGAVTTVLQLQRTAERAFTCEEISVGLSKVCNAIGMQYFSIIVTRPCESAWTLGNINYERPSDEKAVMH